MVIPSGGKRVVSEERKKKSEDARRNASSLGELKKDHPSLKG